MEANNLKYININNIIFLNIPIIRNMSYTKCCNLFRLQIAKHSASINVLTNNMKKLFPGTDCKAKICDTFRKKADNFIDEVDTDVYSIVYNLKKKLQDENISKNDKTLLLNLLPELWSARRISTFSNSTLYSAAKLKNPEHYTSNKK